MNGETGSVEFGAVMILVFLSSAIAASLLFFSVAAVYFQRSSSEEAERTRTAGLIGEIAEAFQPIKDYPCDYRNNPPLSELILRYASLNLDIRDVSSGYRLDFLSDEELENPLLKNYLFTDAAAFISLRENRGLSPDRETWRFFVNDSAWDTCVSYGWINPSRGNSFAFRYVKHTIGDSGLFPLANRLPVMNINMIEVKAVEPLIMTPGFGVKNPAEKIEILREALYREPVSKGDLSVLLELPGHSKIFSYLGVKTAFWKIHFMTPSGFSVEAILAAVPESTESETIGEYRLIEWSINREP
ncbi:MAG: hypothetical protein LBG22_08565 [Treponema sp.]|nr:hypothetical protein [Treponema sp.]